MEVSCWVIEQSLQGEHKSLNFLRTVKQSAIIPYLPPCVSNTEAGL